MDVGGGTIVLVTAGSSEGITNVGVSVGTTRGAVTVGDGSTCFDGCSVFGVTTANSNGGSSLHPVNKIAVNSKIQMTEEGFCFIKHSYADNKRVAIFAHFRES